LVFQIGSSGALSDISEAHLGCNQRLSLCF
jgi:hypothetical protein